MLKLGNEARPPRRLVVILLAALLAGFGLAAAAVWAGTVSGTSTVTVVSADGTTLTPGAAPAGAAAVPAARGITTREGLWTFGAPPNANGDYPLLLNGSPANGGAAVLLQVTNTNLYAKTKSGAYWVRWNGAWAAAAGAPTEGTTAKALSFNMILQKIPDNSPAGTVIAQAIVTMSTPGAQFTGAIVSDNPFYKGQGTDIVLSRDLTPKDDGFHPAVITAVQ